MLSIKALIPLLCALALALVRCDFARQSPSMTLVIAVEGLHLDEVNCEQPNEGMGFAELCSSFIRYTHAYTPSAMSQAALASFLTLRQPFEHGVRHNGAQFLKESEVTIPEMALEKGFRTAFIGGGAPIWHRSGLGQGFEVFDDNVQIGPSRFYRPAQQVFRKYMRWVDEIRGQKNFALLHVNDLLFAEVSTFNDENERRPRRYTSQVDELDESLGELFRKMRREKVWHRTNIVFMGLNGHSIRQRPRELDVYNLFSDVVQVPLFIKHSEKPRDIGLPWKVDADVGLMDVAYTLALKMGLDIEPEGLIEMQPKSLTEPEYSGRDRVFYTESGWPAWRGVGEIRQSLRVGGYSLIFDRKTKIYNSLIDRFEIVKIPLDSLAGKNILARVESLTQAMDIEPWEPPPTEIVEKLTVASRYFRHDTIKEDLVSRLDDLAEDRPWDEQIEGWIAREALQKRDWSKLVKMGTRRERDLWRYLAAQDRGRKVKRKLRGCMRLFSVDELGDQEFLKCPREYQSLRKLVSWSLEKDPQKKLSKQENFLSDYVAQKLLERVGELNFVNSLRFFVPSDQPGRLPLDDLYLTLPKAKREATIVRERMKKLFVD